jgi:hypothetical protein
MKPIRIKLPNKPPKVVQKEQQPDQRQFSVVPIRAATDRTLTPMQLRTLMVFCSYANRAGITWVSLKRIGEHLNISVVRTSILTAALISKGYIKVLYKGFAGERAQTRQIIFNQALSLEDIIAVSGEKAPYIEQQEEKDYRKQQLKQQRREEVMARKRKVTDPSVISSDLNNLNPGLLAEIMVENVINEEQVMQLQRAVGADLLQYALSQCGDQPTLEQVQTKLKELLA